MNFAPPKNDAPSEASHSTEKLLTPANRTKQERSATKTALRLARKVGSLKLPCGAISLPFDSPERRARSGQNFDSRNFGGGGVARRALCALSRAQSRGTPDEEIFLFATPALQLILARARRGQCRVFFSPHQPNRTARGGPARTFARVVIPHALRRIIGDADVQRIIGTAEDVAVIHKSGL